MRGIVAFLAVLFAGSALAQMSGEPVAEPKLHVRAYLEPDKDIYVGQLVRLWIEVTTSTWFTKAPRYPELQLEGAIVLMPEQLGVNFTNRVGGSTRTGQRQRYAIIPQREGVIEIPALTVTMSVSVDGKPSDLVTLQAEPLRITAAMPPGAQALEQILTTRDLAVEESYDREFDDLKVGDAIMRTVTLRGEDTFALALPATKFPSIEGARAYPAQPVLEDMVNRGQYRALRTDSVTYVLEQAGTVKIPEIVVRWWNPESEEIEKKVLPAADITIAANPDYRPTAGLPGVADSTGQQLKNAIAAALDWLRSNIVRLTLVAFALYLFGLALRRLWPPLAEKWRHWRVQSRHSERRFFRDFQRACRSADNDAIVSSFWKWLDRLSPTDRVASLEQLAKTSRDTGFLEFAKRMSSSRYGATTDQPPSSSDVLQQVTRLRRQVKSYQRTTHGNGRTLNPRSCKGSG